MTALLLCFSLLLAAMQFSTVDSALPCNSPLRKYLPHHFTHCPSCSYGQWSLWTRSTPPQVRTNQTCDSGKARKYERSRTAVAGSTCTPNPDTEYKYECKKLQTCMSLEHTGCLLLTGLCLYIGEPTLRQKAELIIRSLRLGVDAGSTTTPPPRPVTRPRLTAFRKKVTTSPSFKIFSKVTTRPPSPTINYCPTASQQANNRVCPNICPRGMHCIVCTMHSVWDIFGQ